VGERVVAARVVGPRVVVRAAGTLAAAALTAALAAAGRAAAEAAAALAAGPLGPGDLGRGVPQGRADLVDLDLVHGALLAFLGLIGALPQPPRDDHPHAALQRLGHVLGRLPPHVAGQEEAVAVLPLVRRP